jgi:hypothetical protein
MPRVRTNFPLSLFSFRAVCIVVGRADFVTFCLQKSHCLTGNLPLSASNPSFPPALPRSVLQGRNVAHQLWSGRRTWRPLERMKKMFHEATRGRSLSPPHTDRLLHVSRGGERGTVLELSGKTCIAPTGRPSVPGGIAVTEKDAFRCLCGSNWIPSYLRAVAAQPRRRGEADTSTPPSSTVWTRSPARAVSGLARRQPYLR